MSFAPSTLFFLIAGCGNLFAQLSAIEINILHPQVGSAFEGAVSVGVSVNSTYELQFVRASVEGVQTNLAFASGNWTNTLSLAGVSTGSRALVITAQDIFGFSVQTQRDVLIRHDQRPVLTVLSPLNHSVWPSPSVYVEASATDGFSSNCVIQVREEGNGMSLPPLLLAGTNSVKGFVTPSAPGVRITATDELGLTTVIHRKFIVEPNSNLVRIASAPGQILDFDDARFLYAAHPDSDPILNGLGWSLAKPRTEIMDRDTGIVTVAPDVTNRVPYVGFLTANGAFLHYDNYPNPSYFPHASIWFDGMSTNLGLAFAPRLVNDIAGWSGGGTLFLRDANNPSNQFRIDAMVTSWVLGSNNDLLYTTNSPPMAIIRSRPVNPAEPFGVRTTTELTANGGDLFPESDGTNVYYNGANGLMIWTPATDQLLVTNYTWPYLVNNGWIGFTRTGNVGQKQVWTRSPAGVFEQRTFYASSSFLESLGPDGSLTFTNNSLTPKGRYLSRFGAPPWNISAAHGSVRWLSNGAPVVVLGRSVFRVGSGRLQIVPQGAEMQVSFTGLPGQNLQLQSSPDLRNWSDTITFSNPTGSVYLTNAVIGNGRFFRAAVIP